MHFRDILRAVGNELPIILQTEVAECGLACIAMIAGHYGHQINLMTLRQRFSISLRGTTLSYLIRVANQLNLAARPIRANLENLKDVRLPAVLYWEFTHFVVLAHVGRGHVIVHDPARGRRKVSREELSKAWTGIALEITPTPKFEAKRERRKLRVFDLLRGVPGLGAAVLQVLGLAFVLECCAILAPLYAQLVIDKTVLTADKSLLFVLASGFGLLALIQVTLAWMRNWMILYITSNLSYRLITTLFAHLLQLPMSFFEKRHLGDLTARFGSIAAIQRTLTTSGVAVVIDGLMAIATLAMMLIYSVYLAFISVAVVILYGLARLATYRTIRQTTEEQIIASAKEHTTFIETLRGIQAVKIFNRQAQRMAAWQNRLVDRINHDVRLEKLALFATSSYSLLFGVENIIIIGLGAMLVIDRQFSLGMLFAFLSFKLLFSTRMFGLVDKWFDIRMLELHAERIADIALTPREEDEESTPFLEVAAAPGICVHDVSFRYSDADPLILVRVSLDVDAGEVVAITGPSGAGKTTLLKCIMGLLKPTSGNITIGGLGVTGLSSVAARSMISAVMQEDTLFAGSIAENISFFDSNPDEAWIIDCARRAAIHDDVLKMPMQYNTLVSEVGATLSGGQKQRVLLARALYRRPKLLLLDEATSHLDVTRERMVNEELRALGITILMVAHRPETIGMCDRVVDLAGIEGGVGTSAITMRGKGT